MEQVQQAQQAAHEPFHIRVRKRMVDLGMRQVQLCQKTGLHRNTVSAILNGAQPTEESRTRIVSALDLVEEQ